MTKAAAAQLAGVSRSTVTSVLRILADAGLVQDGATSPSTGGRPSTLVRLAADTRLVAVAFGVDQVKVAVTDARLEQLGVRALERGRGADGAVEADRVAAVVDDLAAELGVERPDAVGVVAPVWPDDGATMLERLDAQVLRRWGVRTVVGRAAAAMAVGECFAGSGRGCTELLAVRLGATISAASVTGGRLAEGAAGRAGEIGHVRFDHAGPRCHCGHRGCLDASVSVPALVRQATQAARSGESPYLAARVAHRDLTVDDLIEAVGAADPGSVRIAREAGKRIGRAVAAMTAFADPERVLLGGVLSGLGAPLIEEIRSSARACAPPGEAGALVVELSGLGEWAGLVGAAHLASDDLIDRATSAPPRGETSGDLRRNRSGTGS
jgi:predicted NBD/HSP70 family sugar kinase